MKTVTVRLLVRGSPAIDQVILEPWAGEYSLSPSDTLEVELRGDPDAPIWVEVADRSLVISTFDSAGAEGRVLRDGIELASE